MAGDSFSGEQAIVEWMWAHIHSYTLSSYGTHGSCSGTALALQWYMILLLYRMSDGIDWRGLLVGRAQAE